MPKNTKYVICSIISDYSTFYNYLTQNKDWENRIYMPRCVRGKQYGATNVLNFSVYAMEIHKRHGENMCNDLKFGDYSLFSLIFELDWCKVIQLQTQITRGELFS